MVSECTYNAPSRQGLAGSTPASTAKLFADSYRVK